MLCVYLLMFLFGLACSLFSNDARIHISKQITHGYGHLPSRTEYKQHMNRLIKYPLINHGPYYKSRYEDEDIDPDFSRQKPFYGGFIGYRRNNINFLNSRDLIRIPKQTVLSIISPAELELLYQQNLAHDVPIGNPFDPRQVAISSAFIENLLNMKSEVAESINGVANIFGGLVNVGRGSLRLFGRGGETVGLYSLNDHRGK